MLPLAAAVAVAEVVGERAQIKWPNDVVVEQDGAAFAKVAGILVEGRLQEAWAVLGIGLNVAVRLADLPPELRAGGARPAATMGLSPRELEPTLARLLEALGRRLAEPAGATLEAWRARDALLGREIAWSGGGGIARGIDGEGRLVVEDSAGGRTALAAGEVHLGRVG